MAAAGRRSSRSADEDELLHPVEQVLSLDDVAVGMRVEVRVRGRGRIEDRVDPVEQLSSRRPAGPVELVVALRLDVGVGAVGAQPLRIRGEHLGAERRQRAQVVALPGVLLDY